jgi:hypothetical protein
VPTGDRVGVHRALLRQRVAKHLIAPDQLAVIAPAREEDDVAFGIDDETSGVLDDDTAVREVDDFLATGDRRRPGDQVAGHDQVPGLVDRGW